MVYIGLASSSWPIFEIFERSHVYLSLEFYFVYSLFISKTSWWSAGEVACRGAPSLTYWWWCTWRPLGSWSATPPLCWWLLPRGSQHGSASPAVPRHDSWSAGGSSPVCILLVGPASYVLWRSWLLTWFMSHGVDMLSFLCSWDFFTWLLVSVVPCFLHMYDELVLHQSECVLLLC
jgi:hypothetical protein